MTIDETSSATEQLQTDTPLWGEIKAWPFGSGSFAMPLLFNVTNKHWNRVYGLLKERISSIKPLRRKYYHQMFKMSLRQWLIYHQKEIIFKNKATWMGMPLWKNPFDAWIYQEILYEVKPDVVVEIGSKFGGSTKYFADLLAIIGKGMVASIDIDRSHYNLDHPRVSVLTGNSSKPGIIAEVARLCQDKTVMVIHDGDHRKKQALEDLKNYSRFVSLNSYFIIEDGIVDLFHYGDDLGFQEEGPLAAVEEFLSQNSHFIVDSTRERYILTYNPKSYLKRIS